MLFSHQAWCFNIFVTVPPQKTVILEVEANDTIENVKSKIQEKEGILPDDQLLSFNGVTLEEGRTLADYGIGSNATILLALLNIPPLSSVGSVQGVVSAQVRSSHRFTRSQIQNIFGHLNSFHSAFTIKQNQFNVSVNGYQNNQFFNALVSELGYSEVLGADSDNNARVRFDDVGDDRPLMLAVNEQEQQSNAIQLDINEKPFLSKQQSGVWGIPFRFWASGNVEFGKTDLFGNKNKFSSKGITLGIDAQISDKVIAGASLGHGFGKTRFDHFGSKTKSHQTTASLYASFQAKERLFIDLIAGYGDADFNNDRWSLTDSSMLTGNRDGDVIFVGVGVSNYWQGKKFRGRSFLQGEYTSTTLDSYDEVGLVSAAVSYDKATSQTTLATAGIDVLYDMKWGQGLLTPSLTAKYSYNFSGDVSQDMYYSDLGSSGGIDSFEFSGSPEKLASIGVGLSYLTQGSISLDVNYFHSRGSNSYRSNVLSVEARVDF